MWINPSQTEKNLLSSELILSRYPLRPARPGSPILSTLKRVKEVYAVNPPKLETVCCHPTRFDPLPIVPDEPYFICYKIHLLQKDFAFHL